MIVRLAIAGACLVASYVLFDYAADAVTKILGELFADAVISTDN